MLTKREAQERNRINNVRMQWSAEWQEYRVTLMEWPCNDKRTEKRAYYTNDLEDAVLTGAEMRRRQRRLDLAAA